MLFSEEWLRSYINPDLTTDELAEKLTMAGLEVEEVTSIGGGARAGMRGSRKFGSSARL